MNVLTHFIEPSAVDAWDAWFRWRDQGGLHDLTIDATWSRVADAVARVEGRMANLWAQRFADAFADWQLLPNEYLLRDAGTGVPMLAEDAPAAVLNAAAFVRVPSGTALCVDRDRLLATAALAVRLLDDVLLAMADASASAPASGFRIGMIGMADALLRLGVRYDSEAGRRLAGEIAATLAAGCLQGAIALAAERGHPDQDGHRLARLWRGRSMPSELIADGLYWGVRHSRLTAIDSQPRLALLANNVADALDPVMGHDLSSRDPVHRNPATASRHVSALEPHGAYVRAWPVEPVPAETLENVPVTARIELRAAVQPWIDAPIEYPLIALQAPDRHTRKQCATLAQRSGLPVPRWRLLPRAVSAQHR